MQFVPCLAIPAMTIALPPKYTHSVYWLWGAGTDMSNTHFHVCFYYIPSVRVYSFPLTGWYLLAKVEEATDKGIYKLTHNVVSGHTLKHLCSAMVPVFVIIMLVRRRVETERYRRCLTHIDHFSSFSSHYQTSCCIVS